MVAGGVNGRVLLCPLCRAFKADKRPKPKTAGKRPKRQGGPWGLLGVIGAFTALFVGKILYDRNQLKEHLKVSRQVLAGLRAGS